jgi:hypothetical protein
MREEKQMIKWNAQSTTNKNTNLHCVAESAADRIPSTRGVVNSDVV